MAKLVSLLTLRTQVRERADIEGANARHTDAEINRNINSSIAELYDMLRSAFGQSFFRAQTTFTTTPGVATYPLQSDFLSLVSVDVYVTNNVNGPKYSAASFQENERNKYSGAFGGWTILGMPASVHLFGNNVTFIPTPATETLVQVNYIPAVTTLSSDTDTMDGVNGWEEYVVLDAAIKSLLKDKDFETVGVFEGRKAALLKRITDLAGERDSGQPSRVTDSLSDVLGNGDVFGVGRLVGPGY